MITQNLLETIVLEQEQQFILTKYCNLWENTCFEQYRNLPQTIKGKFGENVVSRYLSLMGKQISKRTNQGNDFVGNSKKIENKFSLCVTDYKKMKLIKNHFMMNHVSKEKDYDILCFLGCNHPSENEIVFFWMHKEEVVLEITQGQYFSAQQGGKKINNDDYMCSGDKLYSLYKKYGNRDINLW